MALLLVLCLAVVPAATLAISLAQTDLAGALDDWNYYKAEEAAKGIIGQIEGQLKAGVPIDVCWPDPVIEHQHQISTSGGGWVITVTVTSRIARVTRSKTISREP